jgi:hypothetical protein
MKFWHIRRVLIVWLACIFVGRAMVYGPPGKLSELSAEMQEKIKAAVESPSLDRREGPYSTPMYYLMYKGYEYRGDDDRDPKSRCYPSLEGKTGPDYGHWTLDRNRPDWQEAMIRDWADLGLNNTHLEIHPINAKFSMDPDYAQAISDFSRLSNKYGMRVGVRLDAPDETVLWSMHPANPHNRRKEYVEWVRQVASLLKGRTEYYVLGDELTLYAPSKTKPVNAWTVAIYADYFKEIRAAIKTADPDAIVSMFASSSGQWSNVVDLLQHGYASFGDAVAINNYDYTAASKFFADRDRLAPNLKFLTNGVGYVSIGTIKNRYPEGDAYHHAASEEEQGAGIAKAMFAWWDLGADTAPYYVSLRNWVRDDVTYPNWYGFFGFEDYVIDHDQLTVKKYPGWHALQTITHIFYNRDKLHPLGGEVTCSKPVSMFRAFERPISVGSELIVMIWNDTPADVTLDVIDKEFSYPTQVDLFDYHHWTDLPMGTGKDHAKLKVHAGPTPVILRMIRLIP